MSLFTLRHCGVQQCEQLLATSLLPHIRLVFTCDVWFQVIGTGLYNSLVLYCVEQIVLTSPFVYWVALYLTLSGYLLFSMIFFLIFGSGELQEWSIWQSDFICIGVVFKASAFRRHGATYYAFLCTIFLRILSHTSDCTTYWGRLLSGKQECST